MRSLTRKLLSWMFYLEEPAQSTKPIVTQKRTFQPAPRPAQPSRTSVRRETVERNCSSPITQSENVAVFDYSTSLLESLIMSQLSSEGISVPVVTPIISGQGGDFGGGGASATWTDQECTATASPSADPVDPPSCDPPADPPSDY